MQYRYRFIVIVHLCIYKEIIARPRSWYYQPEKFTGGSPNLLGLKCPLLCSWMRYITILDHLFHDGGGKVKENHLLAPEQGYGALLTCVTFACVNAQGTLANRPFTRPRFTVGLSFQLTGHRPCIVERPMFYLSRRLLDRNVIMVIK